MKYRYITYLTYITILLSALFVMTRQLGLVDELDFGAGAYYYADIPSFERYSIYSTEYGYMLWLCIALFLVWGWLMFCLWKLVDKSLSNS